jgi:hypothetical protein
VPRKLRSFCGWRTHATLAPWRALRNRDGNARRGAIPDDLYDYARPAARHRGRPIKDDQTTWTVTDDWPEHVPVTEAEIKVFEAWFGDLFEELFSTRH